MWGPPRDYAWNSAKAGQLIAPQGVQFPTARPPGPPHCPEKIGGRADKERHQEPGESHTH